jgi:hypothetical protein
VSFVIVVVCVLYILDTLKELAYAVTLSQRILPFYRQPGCWKGGLAIDGCFSASYTVTGSVSGGGSGGADSLYGQRAKVGQFKLNR